MGGRRGRLISPEDKELAIDLIDEAHKAGARKHKACGILGLTLRTVQRWITNGIRDRRKGSRVTPSNKLTELEEKRVMTVLTSPEYCDLSPNQIVPRLADEGIYYCSESTIYRLFRKAEMVNHRQSSRPQKHKKPNAYVATGPNQVWSWDISYLPLQVRGRFLYLYMMMDIYSRKVVAWQVHTCESDELAADLIAEACFMEQVDRDQIVLHSDNGSPMKGATMLAKLQELGVTPSFSRPRVSDDNPYSESLFKTLKYTTAYPEDPFTGLLDARDWVEKFVDWYNNEHQHSGIRFVTPSDRHSGREREILSKRHQLYQEAKERNPQRWPGNTRNWNPVESVGLNRVKHKEGACEQDIKATG